MFIEHIIGYLCFPVIAFKVISSSFVTLAILLKYDFHNAASSFFMIFFFNKNFLY